MNFLPALLFVCGYAGGDARCVQMIKYLLDVDTQAIVIWVCHTPGDLDRLYKIFHEQSYLIAKTKEDLQSGAGEVRIVATVTDRTDLLLYELFQRLTLSLPRGGFNYQFSHNVPPATSFTSSAPEEFGSFADVLVDALLKEQKPGGKVVVADGESGLTAPLRQTFYCMLREHACRGLWLELEDYANPRALAHEIFARITIRLGLFRLSRDELLPRCRTRSSRWGEGTGGLALKGLCVDGTSTRPNGSSCCTDAMVGGDVLDGISNIGGTMDHHGIMNSYRPS